MKQRALQYAVGTLLAALLTPSMAAAQTAVGAGPLTETLAATEPTTALFSWPNIKISPGLVVQELGFDDNVFDEHENAKGDWVFRGTPDVSVFATTRWFQMSAYAGSQISYYKTYESENAVGYEYRGRVDTIVSRFRPFIGGGYTKSRTRPNGEIDVRADTAAQELSGGLAFELGPHQQVFASAVRFFTKYQNAVEDGVDIATTLNRTGDSYTLGVKTALTPFTNLTFSGGYSKDNFESAPLRDTENRSVSASLEMGSEAVIAGNVTIGYQDSVPVDPLIEPFKGVTSTASVTYRVMEIGRLSGGFIRGMEYSFDEAEAYYIETSYYLSYTHRLFGEVDIQARANRSYFDYGYRSGVPARTDTLDTFGGSVGYNLRNRTRISLNYELTQRRSPAYVDRNYDRERVYLAWLYAF